MEKRNVQEVKPLPDYIIWLFYFRKLNKVCPWSYNSFIAGTTNFVDYSDDLLLEADVKHARQNIRVSLSDIELILDEANGREIQSFNIVFMSKFKAKFSSNKGFITEIESMVLEYYAGIVQYLTNWDRPAPKL